MDRHHQGINGVYLDYSGRKIWLKALWWQKWSGRFEPGALVPDWLTEAPWMAHFKDG
jgi:hypothetical protein